MMKYLLLLLAASASAAPLVQPTDMVRTSSFTFNALAVGTTTANTAALTVYGIVASSTPIPTIACTAGSPAMTAGSTSQFGSYAAGALATGCTVTFATAFPSTPFCQCQSNANLLVYASSVSKTAITCTSATAMTGDTITYFCQGPP